MDVQWKKWDPRNDGFRCSGAVVEWSPVGEEQTGLPSTSAPMQRNPFSDYPGTERLVGSHSMMATIGYFLLNPCNPVLLWANSSCSTWRPRLTSAKPAWWSSGGRYNNEAECLSQPGREMSVRSQSRQYRPKYIWYVAKYLCLTRSKTAWIFQRRDSLDWSVCLFVCLFKVKP